jgi:hypothetical protein
MKLLPAIATYRCYNCGVISEGDETGWLVDEDDRAYPFCSDACWSQPWPLMEAVDGQHYELWSPRALVIQWNPS